MARPAGAAHDLLFGLLALQNGMLDQSQLVAAFGAWTLAKDRPMAEILAGQGALSGSRRTLLEALVAEHVAIHGGDAEKSLAALDARRSVRAELAGLGDPDIEATLGHVGSGSTEQDPSDRTATYAAGVGAATSEVQRFRLLRPHAKGGLGAVFVAFDAELNREVALKQILDGHADDPVSRQRFLTEAEITGGLEHPGIVPVYGLGTYDNGRPYYAMRFIRGDSFKEASDRFHADPALKDKPGARGLEFRKLLRRFLDVCDAIHYAHQRGVIHRDLKPSNIILGKHGETLVVDWGLAKTVGHSDPDAPAGERTLMPSSASGSAETLPGAAMGTPAYMPPEQAAGDLDRLGPTSDVYSLGATLYYVLAGRPPFEGDIGEVLRALPRGEFLPPRSVVPWVDPALNAVCLKAMAVRPQDRYESARALAADVERWTADEPVTAYREPFRRRLSRWERRHKTFVYGGVTVLVVTAAGLAVTATVAREQQRATEAARHQAELKAAEADANFYKSVETAYEFLSRVSDQQLAKVPGMEGIRKDLSDKAYKAFHDFLKAKPDDALLLQRGGRVFRDTAIVRSLLGDPAGAREAYLEAIKATEHRIGLNSQPPQPVDRLTLAKTLGDLASFLRERGLDGEASPHRERARGIVDGLIGESLDDREFLMAFQALAVNQVGGWIYHDDGWAALDEGDRTRARRSFSRAIELLTPVAALPGSWFWHKLRLSQAHRGLAMLAHDEGNPKEADREFAESLAIARAVVAKEGATEGGPRHVLATTLEMNARRLLSDPSRVAEVDAALAHGLTIVEKLIAEYPSNAWYTKLRAELLSDRGDCHATTAHDDLAENDLTEAVRLFQELDRKERDDMTYPGMLGRAKLALGQIRLRRNHPEDARRLIDEAVSHLERACEARPKILRERESLAEAREARRRVSALKSE